MLCLKVEALDDDKTLDSPSSDRSSGNKGTNNGGFVLGVNWGSSIHKYLKKSSKISRRSLSSGDGSLSCSDFEETKSHEKRNGRNEAEDKSQYRQQLEEDVKKLQQKLQEEINLRLALYSAVEHSDSPFSDSPCKLPDEAQELLDSVAVLEITVSKLEQESISLQYQLCQERNERRIAEYRRRHSSGSEALTFNDSSAFVEEPVKRNTFNNQWFVADGGMSPVVKSKDDINDEPPWRTEILNQIEENLWHRPDQLSEEMVLCMRDIFLFLSKSSKCPSQTVPSVSSPQGQISCSSTSFLDSSILTSLGMSPSADTDQITEPVKKDSLFDPYEVPGQKAGLTKSIGVYSRAVEVAWFSVGKNELEYATVALRRYRTLVEQLAKVKPACMNSNKRLSFWINIYNALIMHAYLAYGLPKSDTELSSIMRKAAYVVGGLSFTAADIECVSLKIQRPVHRPHSTTVAIQKSKLSGDQLRHSIEQPEPLLSFALTCGMRSCPALRIFKPENVAELLKASLKDYVRASVKINEKGNKLLVPKLLHTFAKSIGMDESLVPAWLCRFLPTKQASAVNECVMKNKWRLLGARSFSVLEFDTRFRFLFLPEDDNRHSCRGCS